MNYVLQILFVLALMSVGWFARKRGIISDAGASELARLLISFIYPAMVFYSITRIHPQQLAHNWPMPLMAISIFATGLAFGLLSLRWMKQIDSKKASAFLFQSTFNNCLFLPLPLVLLMWGPEGVALLVFATFGFELSVWTLGVFLFNRDNRLKDGLRMVFGPPLVALLFSIAWICVRDLSPWQLPDSVLLNRIIDLLYFGAETIGRATIAVSMIVAGCRIATLRGVAVNDPHIWIASILRLLVVPVVFILLIKHIPLDTVSRNILILMAVMPASVTGLIFSERFDGDSGFMAATLLTTHLGAIITVPLLLMWAL
jgi:predicted permease